MTEDKNENHQNSIIESTTSMNNELLNNSILNEDNDLLIKKPTGLSGWLVILMLKIAITIILSAFALLILTSALSGGDLFEMEKRLIYGFLVAILPILILNIIALVMLVTKNRIFPKTYISIIIVEILINTVFFVYTFTIDFELISFTNENSMLTSFISSVAGGLVWIMYIKKSKRVKNTFF